MATKRKENPQKGGRPSKFDPVKCLQAEKLCKLGATDKELADFFEVSEQTLNAWKRQHPEFLESLKKGKTLADAEVASKLFHRAVGYDHPEDKIFLHEGAPVIVPTIKHYPPDATAAIFWLKNRQRDKWRDKQEVEHTGKVEHVHSREMIGFDAIRQKANTRADQGSEPTRH